MSSAPGSLTELRQGNRRRVLDVLRQRGSVSRVDIARLTGLSRSTVSTLVGELLDESVLVETAERVGGAQVGRPASLLTLNPAAGGVVGVHLAHDHVRLAVTDLAGDVLAEEATEFDVDHRPEDTLDFTAGTALDLVDRAGLERGSITGLGVALSAPVSPSTHAVDPGPILPHWRSVDVAALLHERTGWRIEVGNDANLGAIAERRYGAGQGVDDLVYVMLSDGVGAGLVLGGRLYEGASGGAGELGHVTVVRDGFVCRCGNRGCLETVAGARALTTALSLTRGETTLADVVALERADDPGVARVLGDAGRALGRALVGVCTVLDPSLVVVGGRAVEGGDALLSGVREVLRRELTPLRAGTLPVVAGALGERAEVLGAVALATERMSLL